METRFLRGHSPDLSFPPLSWLQLLWRMGPQGLGLVHRTSSFVLILLGSGF